MKRLLLTLLCLPLLGAAHYVDFGCTFNGDGSAIDCGASNGAAGPWNRVENWTLTCGDTYNIRGVHATHGSNHTAPDTKGRYFGNEWGITNTCTSGTPITIQNYGYTATLGSGEQVYLDGTRCPSSGSYTTCGSGNGWTQCTWNGATCDCDAHHMGVQIGAGGQTACTQTWYTTDSGTAGTGFQSGNADKALWAQKDNGEFTQRVLGLSSMTNATTGYNSSRCTNSADSTQNYIPCGLSTDPPCPANETCSTTSAEIDSYRDDNFTPNVLLVRWGTSLPTRPYIPYTQAGDAFALKLTSAYVTIQGVVMRAHRGPTVWNDEGSDHNSLLNIRLIYTRTVQSGSGSSGDGYGFTFYGPNNLTIKGNDLSYTSDEALHGGGHTTGTGTTVFIRNNFIHDIGMQNIMGSEAGTPNFITIGGGGGRSGDFTGTIIDGNIGQHAATDGFSGSSYGCRLENLFSNGQISNNIWTDTKFEVMDLDGSQGGADNNVIFNNIVGPSTGLNDIRIFCDANGSGTLRNNSIYNNVFYNPGGAPALELAVSTGTCTGNLIRNNIFYQNANQRMVVWSLVDTSNIFENNLVFTTAATAVTWSGAHVSGGPDYSCAQLGNIAASDIANCPSPQFVDVPSINFHIQSSSPAKDAGTSIGMPAARTTDICNMIAVSHGFTSYADCQVINGVWDIGIDEIAATVKTVPGRLVHGHR